MALKIQANQIQLLHYLNEKQSDRQFSRLLEISFTLVVITLFVIFAVRPSVTTIASLFGEVKAKEEFSGLMRQQINKIVEAQDIYAQIQARSDSVDRALGNTPGYVYTKNQILWLASSSQVGLESIDYPSKSAKSSKPVSNTPLRETTSMFQIQTSYESFINFLSKLNQLKKVGQISKFTIGIPTDLNKTKDQQSQDSLQIPDKLEASFVVTFNYWAPDEKK